MRVSELIERLRNCPQNHEIMILDGFNGGGDPREIHFGPCGKEITEEQAEFVVDCEGKSGRRITVLGYGCP